MKKKIEGRLRLGIGDGGEMLNMAPEYRAGQFLSDNSGNDTVGGDSGNDVVTGSEGDDLFFGGNQNYREQSRGMLV